jgi:hypothetical protein
MKIKELKQQLATITSILNVAYEEPNPGSQKTTSKFSKLNQFRKAINQLEETGLFKAEIQAIRNSAIFTTAKDSLSLNLNEGRQLKNQVDEIVKLVTALSTTISEIGGEVNPDSVSIKLPPVNDFDDLSKVSADFHKIINQAIVNDQINGQVRIDNVENGSIWLDVYLGSTAAVSLVGGLAWAAAVIYKKIQEGKLITEHVKSLKIKNESLKEIQEKQKDALSLMIDAEAKNLYNENFDGDNNEQIERLKNSIRLLSNLIEQGAEVHPALNQPENVKNLFPKMNQLQSVESKIKKLE